MTTEQKPQIVRDFYDSLWMRCDLFDPGADALWFAFMAWLVVLSVGSLVVIALVGIF